jgi:5,10-methylenetetrahydromethanopterin reductase
MLTYDFRLPPGPRTVEYAILAEELGFRAIWCPEAPAFGHDIWVTVARIAEKTKRIKFGPSVLIPSYRHPMAQASAIATLEQIAPGRLMVGFGTGFTGRAGMGKKPLSLASMRTHITQVKALLRGDVADIDGGLAQILASDGWWPDRPIDVPVYMAGQGPKARALAKEITNGLISLGGPAEGFETCLVSTSGTVLDDGEDSHLAARLGRRQTAHSARLSPQVHDRSGERESAAERRSVAGQRRTCGRERPPPLCSPRS